MTPSPIAVPGRNCWRLTRASRLSFLVDAEAYYAAVASACEKAQESITITGWAIDSRARLHPGRPPGALPDELGPFLAALVRRRRSLRVRVLAWDVGMVFGIESGYVPVFRTEAERLARFEWELDSEHALGAAQHQKIVVVDDRVAFVTGMDLTGERWDTREHAKGDARRVHAGHAYRPYHDVGVVLDGEPAAALGELVRMRWARATGRSAPLARMRAGFRSLDPGTPLGGVLDRVGAMSQRASDRARRLSRRASDRALSTWPLRRAEAAPDPAADRWPDGVVPQATDVPVALARTEAEYLGQPAVREVEALWLDSIAAARRTIYIENQYFTSRTIAEALAKRLAEADGPEVVILQPLTCSGWLEQATMGVLRDVHLRKLRDADAGKRLRVLHPVAADGTPISLHSKVLVVDDAIARVGSANASNRSMALDTELDAHVESSGRPDLVALVAGLRDSLVSEHLGVSEETLRHAAAAHGSLRGAIDALRGDGRSLHELQFDSPGWLAALVPSGLADPESPADAAALTKDIVPAETPASARRQAIHAGIVGVVVVAMAALWTLLPFTSRVGVRSLAEAVEPWSSSPLAPIVVVAIFIVGGLVAFPMSVLVVATELAFGPWLGSAISLVGGFTSSIIGYGQGRVIGRRWLRRLGGRGLNRVSRALASHGVLTIAAARLMPFVPWTLTNLAAGASHVRPVDYVVGTLVGLVPAVVAAALMADATRKPWAYALLEIALMGLLLGVFFAWGRARLRRTSGG